MHCTGSSQILHETAKTKQKTARKWAVFCLVGVTGFEPATSSSRTTRATKLRHTPEVSSSIRVGVDSVFACNQRQQRCLGRAREANGRINARAKPG